MTDSNLSIKKIAIGIARPTTIAFLGNDILVLQKDDGKVRLIRNGILQDKPILDLPVSSSSEQGLLGITTRGNNTVYLYLTEATEDGGEPIGNRIYRYHWDGMILSNPTMMNDLPASPGPNHNGGAMVTGLDGTVYAVIGDLNRDGVLQNNKEGTPDDTSVVLRVDPPGDYYAMGIRNSFGLAIDPETGKLWDTENGPDGFDEINLVPMGFNSGWKMIMGPANEEVTSQLPKYDGYSYSDPEFSWQRSVAPTGISFVDSRVFRSDSDSILVGDCNLGSIYRFKLNENRSNLVFDDTSFKDKVANRDDSMEELLFGKGFGCITDLEVGPDGLLYVVAHEDGVIYQIAPQSGNLTTVIGSETYEMNWLSSEGGPIPTNFTIHPNSSVEIIVVGQGEITVILPVPVIEGVHTVRTASQDLDFEQKRFSDRTELTFTIPDNTDSIEVLGAFVVPEFAIPLLGVSLAAITLLMILTGRYGNLLRDEIEEGQSQGT